jgi:membrane protein implicated in regulation of membrane protease activity
MALVVCVLLAIFVLPHPWGLAAVIAGATFEIVETGLFIWWSKRRRSSVGVESLEGRSGVAVSDLWPEGQVKVNGEIWKARCDGGADRGTDVVVRAVDGLTLVVEPA